MKAVVFHGIGDIRLERVREPKLEEPNDAIVRITTSAICGTDLHMIRGTLSPMKSGTILGHEGVGIVEAVGKGVRNLRKGDRVVIPSTIGCGYCAYCRAGYFSQCDNANPNHAVGKMSERRMVRSGMIHPATILTQRIALDGVIDAYKAFDRREPGWTKVEIRSAA